jgi:hypothetical protein
VSTIRIYMMNGHNLSNIAKSLEEFERELSAALAREHTRFPSPDRGGQGESRQRGRVLTFQIARSRTDSHPSG